MSSVRKSKKALKKSVSGILGSTRGMRGLGGDKGYWMARSAAEKRARKKNPSKAERAVASQKLAAKRRVAVALAKYLKQQNPAAGKLAGAKIEKLKGGVLKITPIRANRARSKR